MSEEAQQVDGSTFRVGHVVVSTRGPAHLRLITSKTGSTFRLRAPADEIDDDFCVSDVIADHYRVVGHVCDIVDEDGDSTGVGAVFRRDAAVVVRTGKQTWRNFVRGTAVALFEAKRPPADYVFSGNVFSFFRKYESDGWRPIVRMDGSSMDVPVPGPRPILHAPALATERRLRALQRVVRVVHAKLEHRIDLGVEQDFKRHHEQQQREIEINKAIAEVARNVSQGTVRTDLNVRQIAGLLDANSVNHDAINVLRNRAQSIEQRVDELAKGIEHARSRDHLQVQGQNEIVRDLASLAASVTLTRNRADRHESALVDLHRNLASACETILKGAELGSRDTRRINDLIGQAARTNTIAWISLALGLGGWLVAGLAWAGVIAP